MAQAAVKDTTGYVNYVYNISARGTTEVASQLLGLSGMATNILGQLAFQTSSYLSTTEGALLSMGVIATAGFTKATKQAMEFDQALSTVGAISGKTRGEVASLGDDAMAMSSKFGVAVSEMTQGMESLARAGVSQGNMTAILEEAMGLSKLEGLTLDTAINDLISTTNLLDTQGLDLSSPEYAEAVKYQNQKITATSEAAPINAQDIIHTLEHIGGYASSTNLDQDDLYAVIAQLGSKGTKSEMAGTSLRAFISAGQKDTAQRALDRIGLNVKDLWKNDDTIMSITDMKDVLDEAMESRGYTQQEKLEFYSDFAGYKQANQIMKIDTQSAREFKEKIDHSWNMGQKIGQVIGTAETHVQGLIQAGTNLLTKVGEPFLPIISTIAWTLRTGIDMINAIPGSNLIIAGGLILASVKAISTIFNKIVPQIVAAKGNIGSMGGFFGTIKKDLKESYTIIKNINNTDWIQRQAHINEVNHITDDDKKRYWQHRTGKRLYGMTDVYRLEKRHGFTNDQHYIDWKRRENYRTKESRNERHETQNEPKSATESSNNRKDNKKSDCCDSIIQVMKEGFADQISNTNIIKDRVSDIYDILSSSIIDKSVVDDLKTNIFSVRVTNMGDGGFSSGGSRSSQSDTTLQGPKAPKTSTTQTTSTQSTSQSKRRFGNGHIIDDKYGHNYTISNLNATASTDIGYDENLIRPIRDAIKELKEEGKEVVGWKQALRKFKENEKDESIQPIIKKIKNGKQQFRKAIKQFDQFQREDALVIPRNDRLSIKYDKTESASMQDVYSHVEQKIYEGQEQLNLVGYKTNFNKTKEQLEKEIEINMSKINKKIDAQKYNLENTNPEELQEVAYDFSNPQRRLLENAGLLEVQLSSGKTVTSVNTNAQKEFLSKVSSSDLANDFRKMIVDANVTEQNFVSMLAETMNNSDIDFSDTGLVMTKEGKINKGNRNSLLNMVYALLKVAKNDEESVQNLLGNFVDNLSDKISTNNVVRESLNDFLETEPAYGMEFNDSDIDNSLIPSIVDPLDVFANEPGKLGTDIDDPELLRQLRNRGSISSLDPSSESSTEKHNTRNRIKHGYHFNLKSGVPSKGLENNPKGTYEYHMAKLMQDVDPYIYNIIRARQELQDLAEIEVAKKTGFTNKDKRYLPGIFSAISTSAAFRRQSRWNTGKELGIGIAETPLETINNAWMMSMQPNFDDTLVGRVRGISDNEINNPYTNKLKNMSPDAIWRKSLGQDVKAGVPLKSGRQLPISSPMGMNVPYVFVRSGAPGSVFSRLVDEEGNQLFDDQDLSTYHVLRDEHGTFKHAFSPDLDLKRLANYNTSNTMIAQGALAYYNPGALDAKDGDWKDVPDILTTSSIRHIAGANLTPQMQNIVKNMFNAQKIDLGEIREEIGDEQFAQFIKNAHERMDAFGVDDNNLNQFKKYYYKDELDDLKKKGLFDGKILKTSKRKRDYSIRPSVDGLKTEGVEKNQDAFLIYDWDALTRQEDEIAESFTTSLIARSMMARQRMTELRSQNPSQFLKFDSSIANLANDIKEDPLSLLKINAGDAISYGGSNASVLSDLILALNTLEKIDPKLFEGMSLQDMDQESINSLAELGYYADYDDKGKITAFYSAGDEKNPIPTYELLLSKMDNIVQQAQMIHDITREYDPNDNIGSEVERRTKEKLNEVEESLEGAKISSGKLVNHVVASDEILTYKTDNIRDKVSKSDVNIDKNKNRSRKIVNDYNEMPLYYRKGLQNGFLTPVNDPSVTNLPNGFMHDDGFPILSFDVPNINNKPLYDYQKNIPTNAPKYYDPNLVWKETTPGGDEEPTILDVDKDPLLERATWINIQKAISEKPSQYSSKKTSIKDHFMSEDDLWLFTQKYGDLIDYSQKSKLLVKGAEGNEIPLTKQITPDMINQAMENLGFNSLTVKGYQGRNTLIGTSEGSINLIFQELANMLNTQQTNTTSKIDDFGMPGMSFNSYGGFNIGKEQFDTNKDMKEQYIKQFYTAIDNDDIYSLEESLNKLVMFDKEYEAYRTVLNRINGLDERKGLAQNGVKSLKSLLIPDIRNTRATTIIGAGTFLDDDKLNTYKNQVKKQNAYRSAIYKNIGEEDEWTFGQPYSTMQVNGVNIDPNSTDWNQVGEALKEGQKRAQENAASMENVGDVRFWHANQENYTKWLQTAFEAGHFKDTGATSMPGGVSGLDYSTIKLVNETLGTNARSISGYQTAGQLQEIIQQKLNNFVSSKVDTIYNKFGDRDNSDITGKLNGWSDKLTNATDTLQGFSVYLQEASELFPPLSVAVLGLETVITTITKINEGSQALSSFLDIGKSLKAGETFEFLGQTFSSNTNAGKMLMSATGMVGEAVETLTTIFWKFLGPITLITAGLIAIKGALDWSYQSHKKYLESLEEEQKEHRSKVKGLQATNENAQEQARNNRAPRQQAAFDRNAQLAQTRLDNANMTRSHGAIEITRQKNDTLWGDYGISAGLSKISGNYESTASEYEGTTEQTRKIKEAALANPFSSDAMNQVSSYYDANQLAFGIMDEYKDELGKLYDAETSAMLKYHSDDVRGSPEFNKALDDFVEATGITRDHAKQYLDYMQTEHEVDRATQTMQAQADQISASTELKVQAIAFGGNPADVLGLNGIEAQQDSMIKAQADMIKMELSGQLWWKAVWSTITTPIKLILSPIFIIVDLLNAIWSLMTGNIGGAFESGGRAASRLNVFGEAATYWGAWAETEGTDFNAIGQSATDSYNRVNYGNVEQPASGGYHPTHYLNANQGQDRREASTHYTNANRGSYHFMSGGGPGEGGGIQFNPLGTITGLLSSILGVLVNGLLIGGGIYGLTKLLKADFNFKDLGSGILSTIRGEGSNLLGNIFNIDGIKGGATNVLSKFFNLDGIKGLGSSIKDKLSLDMIKNSGIYQKVNDMIPQGAKDAYGNWSSYIQEKINPYLPSTFNKKKRKGMNAADRAYLVEKYGLQDLDLEGKDENGRRKYRTADQKNKAIRDALDEQGNWDSAMRSLQYHNTVGQYTEPWKEYLGGKVDEKKQQAQDYWKNLQVDAAAYYERPDLFEDASSPVKAMAKAYEIKDQIFGKASKTDFSGLLNDPKKFLSDPRNIENMAKDLYTQHKDKIAGSDFMATVGAYRERPDIMEDTPIHAKLMGKALDWKDKYLQGDSIQDVLKDPERTVDILQGTWKDLQGGALDDLNIGETVKDKVSGFFNDIKEGAEEGIDDEDGDGGNGGLIERAKKKLAGFFGFGKEEGGMPTQEEMDEKEKSGDFTKISDWKKDFLHKQHEEQGDLEFGPKKSFKSRLKDMFGKSDEETPMSNISKSLEPKYPKYYNPNNMVKLESPGAFGEAPSVLDLDGLGDVSDNLKTGGKIAQKAGGFLKGKGGKLGKVGNVLNKVGGGASKAGAKGIGGMAKGGIGKAAKGGIGKLASKGIGKVGSKLAAKGIAQVGSKVLGGALIASGIGAPLGLLLESPIGGMLIEGAMDLGGKALGAIGGAIGGAANGVKNFLGFGKKSHYQQAGGGIGGGLGAMGGLGMMAIAGPIGMGVGLLGSIFKTNKDQKNTSQNIGDIAKNILKNIVAGNNKPNNNSSGGNITIQNININTADDPETIKAMFLELLIELQEQVNPRLVSRTVGEPPAAASSTTPTDTTTTDPNATNTNDPNATTNNNNNNTTTNN